MLLISSSSLDEGVLEITAGIGIVVIYVLLPLPLDVPDEELDVIEHVDFFLVKDDFIFPPPMSSEKDWSSTEGGEFPFGNICPPLLTTLQVAPGRLIGANKVVGADSILTGNDVEVNVLLLFSILMLKHCVGANTCGGEGDVIVEILDGTGIET